MKLKFKGMPDGSKCSLIVTEKSHMCFPPGSEKEVSEQDGQYLLANYPGLFDVVAEPKKMPKATQAVIPMEILEKKDGSKP